MYGYRFVTIRMLTLFFLFGVLLELSGCAGFHRRVYSGPKLDNSKLAIVKTDFVLLNICGIDGQKIELSFFDVMLWGGKYPDTVSILPGKHSILPCYQNPYEKKYVEDWIEIETQAGQVYVVRHEDTTESKELIKVWIENVDGTEKTKELLIRWRKDG